MVKLLEKGDFVKLQRLVFCCCYVQLHVVLEKEKEYAS